MARDAEPLVNSAPLSLPSLQRSRQPHLTKFSVVRTAVVVRMLDRQASLSFTDLESSQLR